MCCSNFDFGLDLDQASRKTENEKRVPNPFFDRYDEKRVPNPYFDRYDEKRVPNPFFDTYDEKGYPTFSSTGMMKRVNIHTLSSTGMKMLSRQLETGSIQDILYIVTKNV